MELHHSKQKISVKRAILLDYLLTEKLKGENEEIDYAALKYTEYVAKIIRSEKNIGKNITRISA